MTCERSRAATPAIVPATRFEPDCRGGDACSARAGIAGATSHSGRRTWLTNLSQKGVSVFVLADMAGHRSIQTTQRYVTVNDEMKRNAAELI